MSKLNDEEIAIVQELIDKKQPGVYELKDIFGIRWNSIGSPTDYGSKFKQTVENKMLDNIIVGTPKTNNHQTYIIRNA